MSDAKQHATPTRQAAPKATPAAPARGVAQSPSARVSTVIALGHALVASDGFGPVGAGSWMSPGLAHVTAAPHRIALLRALQQQRGNAFVQRAVHDARQASDVSGEALRRALADRSPGQPLAPDVRQTMEAGLGSDFANVRVHTDAEAASLARDLHANAFARGDDVYFATGRYRPNTSAGRALLAHELTHVAAQHATGAEPTVQRSPESELISQHTTWWGDLREDQLGRTLWTRALRGEFDFVQSVLNTLWSTNRDDVCYEMMKVATEPELEQVVGQAPGRRLLDRIYDELTSGSAAAEEVEQATRILAVKARRITPEQFEAGMEQAKVFPYRLPGLTVLNDAPIMAERRAGGRIWVHMPTRVLGMDVFRRETRTLPTEVFIGGIELPENEVVGVRFYDQGGRLDFAPALILVQLANETTTTVFTKIGEAVGLGLTFGVGGLAGLGIRAGMLAQAAIWADRAALVLGTLASVIMEHRGWIIERFGDDGREFLDYVDIVNRATMYYGFGRALLGMGRTFAGFARSRMRWGRQAAAVEHELSTAQRNAVQQIGREADEVLDNANRLRSARQPGAAAEAVPAGGGAGAPPSGAGRPPGGAGAPPGGPGRPPGGGAPPSGLPEWLEPTAHPPAGDVPIPRRPRGFTTGRATPGRRVRAGTLEGLEPTAQPARGRQPRAGAPSREAQLRGLTFPTTAEANAARRQLVQNLGARPGGASGDLWQGHHLVPWELRTHPVIEEAAAQGWNINGARNGVYLPTSASVPGAGTAAVHLGSHSVYTAQVRMRLDQLQTLGLSGNALLARLNNLADELWASLLAGTLQLH